MSLDVERVRECFWLLSLTLPIGDKKKFDEVNKALKYPIAHVLPQIFDAFAQLCSQYPDDFNGYLELILESIPYMRGETDKLPDVGYPVEEIKKMMALNFGKFKEYKESLKIEKS